MQYGVTHIGDSAFEGTKLHCQLDIPSGTQTIGSRAFHRVPISFLNIADSVTTIGSDAFAMCNSLSEVTIGTGITSIGQAAFYKSDPATYGIQKFTIYAPTPPTLGSGAISLANFAGDQFGRIYVPCEYVDTYKNASGWSSYASKIAGLGACSGESQPSSYFVIES